MNRSAISVLLAALVLCTQTLLASCGLRCDLRANPPNTYAVHQGQGNTAERVHSQPMQAMSGCHHAPAIPATPFPVFDQPCASANCEHTAGDVVFTRSHRPAFSSTQAQWPAPSLALDAVPLPPPLPPGARLDALPAQPGPVPLFLAISSIRV